MGRASRKGQELAPVSVNTHIKHDGGTGIAPGVGIESAMSKPMETGYVEPEERSNPEYLKKLKLEALANEKAKREKAMKAFGLGLSGGVIGASPNSPIGKVQTIY